MILDVLRVSGTYGVVDPFAVDSAESVFQAFDQFMTHNGILVEPLVGFSICAIIESLQDESVCDEIGYARLNLYSPVEEITESGDGKGNISSAIPSWSRDDYVDRIG